MKLAAPLGHQTIHFSAYFPKRADLAWEMPAPRRCRPRHYHHRREDPKSCALGGAKAFPLPAGPYHRKRTREGGRGHRRRLLLKAHRAPGRNGPQAVLADPLPRRTCSSCADLSRREIPRPKTEVPVRLLHRVQSEAHSCFPRRSADGDQVGHLGQGVPPAPSSDGGRLLLLFY